MARTSQWLAGATLGWIGLCGVANAGLLDSVKDAAAQQMGLPAAGGGMALPSLGGNTLGNAAGVLEYCVKNNYLGAGGADQVRSALLSKVGAGTQDAGYQRGTSGILQGTDGTSLDLGQLKSDLKEKACDYVLNNAQSLI